MFKLLCIAVTAGFIATLTMTIYMKLVRGFLGEEKKKRLPPGDVVMSLAGKAGFSHKMSEG